MAKNEIAYNEPFILDAIFREGSGRQEWCQEIGAQWKSVIGLKSYPYPDDWVQHKGPKFFISLHPEGTFLCKGSFRDMFKLWKGFIKQRDGDTDF